MKQNAVIMHGELDPVIMTKMRTRVQTCFCNNQTLKDEMECKNE